MSDPSRKDMDRREFMKLGLAAGTLLPVVGAALGAAATARAADEKLVTEIEDETVKATVQALGYVNESPKADQQCSNCQLYTAGEGGRGKCMLFPQGVVAEGGWCQSYAPKAS